MYFSDDLACQFTWHLRIVGKQFSYRKHCRNSSIQEYFLLVTEVTCSGENCNLLLYKVWTNFAISRHTMKILQIQAYDWILLCTQNAVICLKYSQHGYLETCAIICMCPKKLITLAAVASVFVRYTKATQQAGSHKTNHTSASQQNQQRYDLVVFPYINESSLL